MPRTKIKKNPKSHEIAKQFEKLVDIMFTLRSEDGCPWDRAQTMKDLKQYLLEESYEVLQAMDEEHEMSLREELGDLLFQVVFLGQMMQEKRAFTLLEVLEHIVEKMISRHAHVFGDVHAETPEQALATWETMKSRQAKQKSGKHRLLLEGIPLNLPALLQAHLISSKVVRVGFEWETEQDVWQKLEEEFQEFRDASTQEEKEEEFGDILFTLVNIARKNSINSEDALRAANLKFRQRFNELEEIATARGKEIKQMTLAEMDAIWNEIKEKGSVKRQK